MTPKQLAYAEAYLGEARFNKTEAARLAKYKGNRVTLAAIGYENFKKPHIQAYIQKRLQESAMSADEVLHRLGEQARAEYSDYILSNGTVDLLRLIEDGKAHLIKSIKYDRHGNRVVEFYDAQTALLNIGKHHGLFTDKIEHSWRQKLPSDLTDEAEQFFQEMAQNLAEEMKGSE